MADEVEITIEITTMSDEQIAAAWAAKCKITDEAVEKLFKEGFNSLDAIKLIESEDLAKTKISRGQQKLIIAAVE